MSTGVTRRGDQQHVELWERLLVCRESPRHSDDCVMRTVPDHAWCGKLAISDNNVVAGYQKQALDLRIDLQRTSIQLSRVHAVQG